MNLIQNKETEIIGVLNSGEIGAGRVVLFPSPTPPQPLIRLVPLPLGAKASHYTTFTVVGDSLESDDYSAHVGDGDILVVRLHPELRDIISSLCAIRLFRTEQTAKWVRPLELGRIELSSNNPRYPPETFDAEQVEILGVVISVCRGYPPRRR